MMGRILVFCLLSGTMSVLLSADTFFIYLEETNIYPQETDKSPKETNIYPQESADAASPYDSSPHHGGTVNGSTVKEGLFNGLFDLNHIVFDNVRPSYRVRWQTAEFKELIHTAADGGAQYVVAAKVTHLSSPYKKAVERLKSTVQYYCYEVKREVLVGRGVLTRNNWGREIELNEEKLGLLLGQDLSFEIDRICGDFEKSSVPDKWLSAN